MLSQFVLTKSARFKRWEELEEFKAIMSLPQSGFSPFWVVSGGSGRIQEGCGSSGGLHPHYSTLFFEDEGEV